MNGFTEDIVTLATCRHEVGDYSLRDALRDIEGSDERRGAWLRDGVVNALASDMLKTPPFVQQIVARALMEHVDWAAAARCAAFSPEDN